MLQDGVAAADDALAFIQVQSGLDEQSYISFIKEYIYYLDFNYVMDPNADELQNQSVILVPIGAENPTVSQIDSPLEMDIYTHSATDFYQILTN